MKSKARFFEKSYSVIIRAITFIVVFISPARLARLGFDFRSKLLTVLC